LKKVGLETFEGFKEWRKRLPPGIICRREKEICFVSAAPVLHVDAVAVAVLGAVWIILLLLLPFGYFATQECKALATLSLGHCYGCIDVMRPFSLLAKICVCTAVH
jgi:hypothetical protein